MCFRVEPVAVFDDFDGTNAMDFRRALELLEMHDKIRYALDMLFR